jgi:hypothetical protein
MGVFSFRFSGRRPAVDKAIKIRGKNHFVLASGGRISEKGVATFDFRGFGLIKARHLAGFLFPGSVLLLWIADTQG